MLHLAQLITSRFLVLQLILSYQLKDLMSIYLINKVVSTDHKQANNLTSLIICVSKQQIYLLLSFVNVKTNVIF